MKKNYKKLFMLLFCGTLAQVAGAQSTVLHYWNFNDNSSIEAITAVSQSVVGTPSLTAFINGETTIDFAGGTGQNFDVLNLNAQNNDPAGTHLRYNQPIGGSLIFALPTTGYRNVIMNVATRRSGSSAGTQTWSYSTDGTNFTTFITREPNNGDPALVTIAFTALPETDNNPNFKIKVEFSVGPGGDGGNNRFDNFTLTGTPLPGTVDTTAPVVTVTPENNAANVAVNTVAAIAFNENVRLVNNEAITNVNAGTVAELRVGDATGAVVPTTATFANNTITLTPVTALANNEQYYVALLANSIEDTSDNAVATVVSSTFSTIAVQSPLTAGDLAFVAYRMNATGTEDEIALVTFVDIAPGTMINFTDAKYTTNAQPQCTGGFTWTADSCLPAGSVITIQTDTLVANTGSTAGSGFGLSSGGDQVIVYTGTAASPNYITALSSKGWVAANTTCNGSDSMLPAGLTDLVTASNLSTAPGNTSGNTVNAYYSGTNEGTVAELKTAILNPENWTGVAGSTTAQVWPEWAFPSSPTVQGTIVENNTTLVLTFNNELNETEAADISNYTGISGLATATVVGNVVTLTYGTPFAAGTDYELTVTNITDEAGLTMACPYVFSFNYNSTVSLDETFVVVSEGEGTLNFVVNLENPATGSVDLVLKTAPFSTADAGDFTYETRTLNFTGTSDRVQTIAIPIIDDAVAEQQAEYFVLSLENPVGVSIEGDSFATVYIKDNDVQAPVPSRSIALDYVTSFDPSGVNDSTCEIVAYDPVSRKLFATSAVEGRLDIINFENPEAPQTIQSINMNTYGGVTSVAVKNGVVAVASPNADEALNGSVVFFSTDGEFISQVTVGALPDNISFTPDGTKVLTANEGQPNADYSIDPEGSVSIIDISGGVASLTNANVTTLGFEAYNSPEAEAALRASGVRKLKLTSTMSQDFEPEYITTSADSQKAWVALQENNAIAEINLTNNTITDVWALGTKDMSQPGNGFDISDNNGEVLIANWPIQTYFIPDGVATYSVNGTNYIVTANEGDEKEYTGFVERTTVGAGSYNLDAVLFPQAEMLKKSFNAGRFRVSNLEGLNQDGTGYNGIYALGSRSFSIFNADTKEIVFDSGDDFEMYTSTEPSISALFNADSEDNTAKGRSRAKGPEPEGVTVAHIGDRVFAFVGLERIGGVMVYDVTDPTNAQFVDYANTRLVSSYGGDNGPEGIVYINNEDSPNATPYIIVANEISGTLTIFEVNTDALSTNKPGLEPKTFVVFPNPSETGIVYFNRVADVEVYDYSGKLIKSAKQALTLDTTNMASGIYLVKTSEGIVKKLVIK
ncbi:T9SS type A sorting domain-containing protein [Flavobacterium sp. Sd200]|uniref:choice-of-anchor I family protein n=1 Tax=Flavobacterium sp. Sd200 TaxID=2692211 RepID=UPI00136BBD4B|nr:choice-of-anchor I family protein [Flavobacterium sp. Sd200]MXN89871.1 T9SS type A sorting domain-containing protein [Flavobacterium sp. Sd200]